MATYFTRRTKANSEIWTEKRTAFSRSGSVAQVSVAAAPIRLLNVQDALVIVIRYFRRRPAGGRFIGVLVPSVSVAWRTWFPHSPSVVAPVGLVSVDRSLFGVRHRGQHLAHMNLKWRMFFCQGQGPVAIDVYALGREGDVVLETGDRVIESVTVARGYCPESESAAGAGRGRQGRGVGDAAVRGLLLF